MLQETIERLDFLRPSDIYISTNKKYLPLVKKQIGKQIPGKNLIIEPDLRDTAPCIGLAAAYIGKNFPNEVMCVIYADHLMKNKKELVQKLKAAEKLAKKENTLNIVEVKAKYPNVNLGYVKTGKKLADIDGTEIFAFEKFTEKPDLKTARKFLQSKQYLWNTGLYVWKVETILDKFKKHLPNTHKQLLTIQKYIGTAKEEWALNNYYPKCDKISIDYGIMEKVSPKEVRIIPAILQWSDVGTWESIFSELAKHKNDNIIKAEHLGIDTKGCLIYGIPKKIIATIGIDDLAIIDTEDALLICKKEKSQDVKKIVEKLKAAQAYNNLL